MRGSVYLITNLINDKLYVGQTNNVARRWKDHRRCLSSQVIGRAMRKHGRDNFEMQVIGSAECGDELDGLERLWILMLGSYKRSNGYNVTMGGDSTFQHSAETRKKIGDALRGRPSPPCRREAAIRANLGSRRSPETREKMAAAKRGRKLSAETRARMSASHRARLRNANQQQLPAR